MTIIDLIFGMACVILGFVLCRLYYEVFEKDYTTEKAFDKLPTIEYPEFEKLEDRLYLSEHFFNYDLSKQDFVITGDRHADTIEKSFNKNEVKHSKESWKYTFENGESTNSNHPLNYDELKPFVDKKWTS